MNVNLLIKALIFVVVFMIGIVIYFIIKLINPNLDSFKSKNIPKNNKEEFSEKEINDSIDKREERIKALKEVGKKLGG
jgi:predicted Holliday junction resolvase-like endonuclease